MKRFFSVLLIFALMCSIVAIPVSAEANSTSIAKKTATSVDEEGRYEVEIQVPGEDGKSYHDEIIVMVDGSYSTDDDWNVTRQVILEIGNTVLEGSGNTLLTVMTFGMGDNIVLKHVESVSELNSTLTELPGGLLYGRSSTNCEAGFTGIEEYINNHDTTLNEVHVIYITDGEINTDETEYVFADWTKNTWLQKDVMTLIKWALGDECGFYGDGLTNLSDAYKTVFGDVIFTPEQVVEEDVISTEELMAWSEQVWKDVYEYSDMELEKAYTVSDAERAFVKYDKEHETHVQEMFYYALWGRKYPNAQTRTPEAGLELAKHEKLAHLYMVDSNKATSWMKNMTSSASNVSFYESGSVKNLLTTIEEILTNLAYTPYNDVIVTDYMSKWVNLDQTTIKVVDNYAGETIWTNKDGWLITENRPTSQEVPVVVEEVSSEAYVDGGPNVVGNENGTIYKLTWYVKDGAMLRNHNYSLVYEVDVDIEETGFEYDTNYPANGETTIEYTEKNGDENTEVTENISVPDVIVDKLEPEPTPEPTAEPTPEPTAEPTPEPTAEPTPEPTAEPTPEPTAEPTPEPTAEPTPEPTAEPTPEPTAEPTPEPTAEPTPEPTAEPTPEPTVKPTQKPNEVPATGDNSNIYLYVCLAIISGTAFVVITVISYNKKKHVIK